MRSLLLLCALTLAVSVSAQEKFIEEPVGWRGNALELQVISDAARQQDCLLLFDGDSIRAFILDNQKAIVRRFYFTRLRGEEFLGGFIKEGRVHAYFESAGAAEIHEVELIVADGVANDFKWPFRPHSERAVAQLNGGDHFLSVAINKKTDQIVIYDFRGYKPADTLHYTFEAGLFNSLTAHGFFNRELHIAVGNPDHWLEMGWASAPSKLYARGDTLYLLMNKWQKGVTAVFGFGMRTKKVVFRTITHNNAATLSMPHPRYEDNSMLLDNRLYFVSADELRLYVQIRDFASGALLKEFSVRGDEDLSLRNTPVVVEGPHHYYDHPRALGTTHDLLYEMTDGSAMVLPAPEDDGLMGLTIGSWKEETVSRPGVPNYTEIHSTRFKMLVDPATLEHVPGKAADDIRDRIGEYGKSIKIPPQAGRLFANNGRWVYAFYNRDTHSLEFAMFPGSSGR
ncbi:MAG TPA: hypothetical protein VHE34_25685 [Puia sp.]|uniref:hypothetical protein n=1 Tax=Puia sp. TaxID=2045100 RepID=UPI002B88175F|nr:hypothetical protein [Puia sp.]HVU98650.1 hypothetical protein [Puia sp.]